MNRRVILGGLIGAACFAYQLSLPPLFRGKMCCDSVIYMNYARMIVKPRFDVSSIPVPEVVVPKNQRDAAPAPGVAGGTPPSRFMIFVGTLFTNTSKYFLGYSWFLAPHILIANALHIAAWVELSLLTAFAIQAAAIVFLWTAARKTGLHAPSWTLALALAHPALATQAAIPMGDTLAIAMLLFGFGCVLLTFEAKLSRKSIGLAVLAGLFLSYALWIRSIYSYGIDALCIAWLCIGIYRALSHRQWNTLLIGIVMSFSVLISFSPRLIACYRAGGSLCILPPDTSAGLISGHLHRGFLGARTYTILRPLATGQGIFLTVPDPFIQSLHCDFTPADPMGQLVQCVLRHWWQMPVFVAKKALTLFDYLHLSVYATYTTPYWLRFLLRLTMIPVLLGLLGTLWLAITRHLSPTGWLVILMSAMTYILSLIPLAIEFRYGLLLIPLGIVGLGQVQIAWATIWSVRHRAAFSAVAACFIIALWMQAVAWDRLDPIPYVPLSRAATEDVLRDVIQTLPPITTQ